MDKANRATHPTDKPFQPAIGRDFGSVEEVDARTRDFLAKSITVLAGTGVSVAGIYGVATKDFRPLTAVWSVIGPVTGAIVAYYFGPRRDGAG
ncbi:hypothetical protein [Rhodopila sp.]|jgi:hypothetical protein|uniref:hypothetical protein n=1 Tax=Rhodopila sp. TaxID=2480087 RepID=UPI002B6F58E0|nr:hypothetical protein [Rhodopila sp.]HVZ08280.1 hypothetical protein [Rhodopila sp.]